MTEGERTPSAYPPCVTRSDCPTGESISEAIHENGVADNLFFLKRRCIGMRAILEDMGDYVGPDDCPSELFAKYLPPQAFDRKESPDGRN